MATKKMKNDSLEYSIKRLEEIVQSLEKGNVSLDEAVKLYEEGVILSKKCAEKLKAVELKVKKLSKEIDGKLTTSDLEEE